MPRFNYTTDAEVFRQTYVGGKGSYLTTGNTYCGFFQPIDPDQNTIALQIMNQAYSFQTDDYNDIQPNDTLLIDSLEYRVRGVRVNNMMGQNFKTCVLELPLKE